MKFKESYFSARVKIESLSLWRLQNIRGNFFKKHEYRKLLESQVKRLSFSSTLRLRFRSVSFFVNLFTATPEIRIQNYPVTMWSHLQCCSFSIWKLSPCVPRQHAVLSTSHCFIRIYLNSN